MTARSPRLAPLIVALATAAVSAGVGAASSASSAASDSLTTSSGSVSDSFRASSRGSSPNDKRLASGDYRIVAIAAVAARPGRTEIALAAVDGDADADVETLELPQAVVARTALATGDVVSARQRPYGVEFARAGEPFFLVLDDAIHRELQNRRVAS